MHDLQDDNYACQGSGSIRTWKTSYGLRKWERQEGAGTRVRVPRPRAERLCRLCEGGVEDELHLVAECTAYAAVQQRHARLFEGFRGSAAGGAQGGVLI